MQKNRYVILLIIGLLLITPSFVSASSYYENDQGLELTNEEYSNLLLLYSPAYIDTMTIDDYEELMAKEPDFDTVSTTKKFIKTVINHATGITNSTQISEAQYNSVSQAAPASVFIETQYKIITLAVLRTGSDAVYATFNCRWKALPSTTSFDLIGFRTTNLDIVNTSQTGRQIYDDVNYVRHVINYSYNGTNINNQLNGFGISMNLVDQDINYLECQINGDFAIEDLPVKVFASYQHAVSNVSLAFSKNYTLEAGGMGNVFYSTSNFYSKYDGMQGVWQYFVS